MLHFNTTERKTSAGMWIKKSVPDSPFPVEICGNVMVKCMGEKGRSGSYIFYEWRIFIRIKNEWVMVHPHQRPWGYGHAGQAKIGARLMGNRHGKKS